MQILTLSTGSMHAQVCGHIHEGYGAHNVPHPNSEGGKGITLINAAAAYMFRGHPDAAPRVVELPSGNVTQPLAPPAAAAAAAAGGAQARELAGHGQQAVWKAPLDVVP
jgi:hypothetical protein